MVVERLQTASGGWFPGLITSRKSRVLSPAQDRALQQAASHFRGHAITLPVFLDGEPWGLMRGEQNTTDVWCMPFDKVDDMVTALLSTATTVTRKYSSWFKNGGAWTSPLGSRWNDMWNVGGNPLAGSYTGTANTARQLDDTVTGGLCHGKNVNVTPLFASKYIMGGWMTNVSQPTTVIAYDRVLTYEACPPSATLTTMTNTLAAQRYISAGQPGLQCMAIGSGGVLNTTCVGLSALAYVNQAGTAGQAAPVNSTTYQWEVHQQALTTEIPAEITLVDVNLGSFPFLPLAVGDSGMRSITSHTSSAGTTTSGTFTFALVYPLVVMASAAATPSAFDWVRALPALPQVYDGAHISFMMYWPNTTSNQIMGGFDFGWSG